MKVHWFSFIVVCPAVVGCASWPSGAPGDDPTRTAGQPIIGGAADTWHRYVVGVGNSTYAFCTGTVISRRTVITAGHCFSGISRVFFGESVGRSARTIEVAKAIRHPGFIRRTLENDLTVLELASDAPVQPAPLLRETMTNDGTYVGPEYTFVGYGISSGVSGAGFGTRRAVRLPIQAVGPAQVGGTPGMIDGTQFYYDAPNRNTCNGDSGGPAFVVRDGVERHAGVTSFGDDPCLLDGVQARTDAPQIAAFIQPEIDAFEAGDPCRADGVCNASCNTGPELVDPDCAADHCGADGVCAIACVAPPDPDCAGQP